MSQKKRTRRSPSASATSQRTGQGRISISIPMPSMALQRFIERALRDDEFFESAIENPLGALREGGVGIKTSEFTPKDFATFFGALAGAKEVIKKKQIKEITFESIFGRAAEIRGATLLAETQKGMWTLFNRNALIDRQMFSSVSVKFETLQEANLLLDRKLFGNDRPDIVSETETRTQLRMARIGPNESVQNRGTDRGVSFHFDGNKGIGAQKSSSTDTYTNKNFPAEGIAVVEQLLMGPLISPAELAAISAKIEAYTQMAEQVK